ncbi:MAG: hypothetical protein ABL867_06295 [Rickettsiales bacterium]
MAESAKQYADQVNMQHRHQPNVNGTEYDEQQSDLVEHMLI